MKGAVSGETLWEDADSLRSTDSRIGFPVTV